MRYKGIYIEKKSDQYLQLATNKVSLSLASSLPLYQPFCARLLAWHLSMNACCAAWQFSYLPCHVLTQEFWSALPKLKDKCQGLRTLVSQFIAFRLRDASSSLQPPLRKLMPTRAGGHVLLKANTVLIPTSSAVMLPLEG